MAGAGFPNDRRAVETSRGIPGLRKEAVDRLFGYCYVVTPARYHDVSRHLHRLSGYQVGAPSA